MEYAEVTGIYATGDYSDINLRYKEEPEGEPVYLLSYAQVKFLLAEASVRGWLASDAETHYREGIAASMQLIASVTPEDEAYNHGRLMDEAYINGYYAATPQVQLTGSETDRLEQIMVQKYLSGFLQSPMTSFYENRRTGFPAFTINEATNLNLPADRFPVRWMYPSSELQYNSENVNTAIDRQYNGVDDTNGLMWILQ
jgi:hypothetical protein